jgi:hypothetical protein
VAAAVADRLILEVSGPEVRSLTVDAAKMLEFGSAFLSLIQKMAKEDGTTVPLRGLSVLDKCVALAIPLQAEHATYVRQISDISGSYVLGGNVPRGLRGPVNRLKDALRGFPIGYKQKIIIGSWERDISVTSLDSNTNPPYAIESVRAMVLKVGGKYPTVRLQSLHDESAFTVDVDRELAKKFAEHLYDSADLTLKILRTSEGKIVIAELARDGEVIFVSKDDPTEAWKRWFQPHADHWNGIVDIEGELRNRDRSQ